jgi:hypothetical protein
MRRKKMTDDFIMGFCLALGMMVLTLAIGGVI